MDIHVNAKTTLKMRQLIVRRVAQGWTYRQIAQALSISERTVAKRVARSRQGVTLCDGCSRPAALPDTPPRRRRLPSWRCAARARRRGK